jgi:hypothetical protein
LRRLRQATESCHNAHGKKKADRAVVTFAKQVLAQEIANT